MKRIKIPTIEKLSEIINYYWIISGIFTIFSTLIIIEHLKSKDTFFNIFNKVCLKLITLIGSSEFNLLEIFFFLILLTLIGFLTFFIIDVLSGLIFVLNIFLIKIKWIDRIYKKLSSLHYKIIKIYEDDLPKTSMIDEKKIRTEIFNYEINFLILYLKYNHYDYYIDIKKIIKITDLVKVLMFNSLIIFLVFMWTTSNFKIEFLFLILVFYTFIIDRIMSSLKKIHLIIHFDLIEKLK